MGVPHFGHSLGLRGRGGANVLDKRRLKFDVIGSCPFSISVM
jgi:hypothetical protein